MCVLSSQTKLIPSTDTHRTKITFILFAKLILKTASPYVFGAHVKNYTFSTSIIIFCI